MQCGWNRPGGKGRRGRCGNCCCLIGAVLVAVGLVVLFLCIPDWAWLALLGGVLIAIGCLLLKNAMAGR